MAALAIRVSKRACWSLKSPADTGHADTGHADTGHAATTSTADTAGTHGTAGSATSSSTSLPQPRERSQLG